MSETKHTPEPWIEAGPSYGKTKMVEVTEIVSVYGETEEDESETICEFPPYIDKDVRAANASRIVLCVNACKNLTNGELDDLIHLDGLSLDMLEKTQAQRDTAWQELREIREAIKADENESTADEVRSLVAKNDKLQKIVDEKKILKRIDNLYDRLTALEAIATAVVGDIEGVMVTGNVLGLKEELIMTRKALGILPEQEQTTTLGMEGQEV